MFRLGVIPAGGKGERWGGYLKELLPIEKGKWLIDHTIRAMGRGGADAVLIVTSKEKLPVISAHLGNRYAAPAVYYATEPGELGMWGGIEEALLFPADRYLFAMPDTFYPYDAFMDIDRAWNWANAEYELPTSFLMGIHATDKPERFGVLDNGRVVDKEQLGPGLYDAWGILAWDNVCAAMWQDKKPQDYTEAINEAIEIFGVFSVNMNYYYDMATFNDYQEFLNVDIF